MACIHFFFKDTFTGDMNNNLPLFPTPSLKRIYTKAHSLNLHHPGLCPVSTKGYGDKDRRTKRKRRQFSTGLSWDPAQTKNENLWCMAVTKYRIKYFSHHNLRTEKDITCVDTVWLRGGKGTENSITVFNVTSWLGVSGFCPILAVHPLSLSLSLFIRAYIQHLCINMYGNYSGL